MNPIESIYNDVLEIYPIGVDCQEADKINGTFVKDYFHIETNRVNRIQIVFERLYIKNNIYLSTMNGTAQIKMFYRNESLESKIKMEIESHTEIELTGGNDCFSLGTGVLRQYSVVKDVTFCENQDFKLAQFLHLIHPESPSLSTLPRDVINIIISDLIRF